MGLDVSVYTNITLCDNIDDSDFVAYVINDSWLWKIQNLVKDQAYNGTEENVGVSYPYSFHSRFRKFVLLITGISGLVVEGDIVWNNLIQNTPFEPFVNFADNEGVLDWEVSKVIYNDFEKYKEAANKYAETDIIFDLDRMKREYLNWLDIFKVA